MMLPIKTDSKAVFPYSLELEESAQRISRFDEQFSMCKVVPPEIWLPRGMYPISNNDQRDAGVDANFANNFTAKHDDQKMVVDRTAQLLLAGESFIVQAPTGYGKTYVGCAVAAKVNKKTLIITTKEDIIDQWKAAAMAVLGLKDSEVGIWRGDQVPSTDCKFVISLVHSVLKGPERYSPEAYEGFGLIIIDEVHRMGADEFSQAMWWFPAKLRLGLSATVYRKDGKDEVIFSHIGPVKVVAQQDVMIPKVLFKHTGWKVPIVWRDGKRVKMPHQPGRTMHLSKAMSSDVRRNMLIVSFLAQAVSKGRNTMVFSDIVEHLTILHSMCLSAGISVSDMGYYVGLGSEVYSGGKADQKAQREKAKLKKVIFATYKMASEATDIPWLDTCVLGTPKSDVNQIVGRIRREYPDKKTPAVLDLVDSDSPIFLAFAKKREQWYRRLGAEVVIMQST